MLIIISKIPEILKKLRLKCGFTQEKVASSLGIDRSTYSYYESGKIKPDVGTLLRLSKIYGVDYTEILDADAEVICADVSSDKDLVSLSSSLQDKEYGGFQEKAILIGLKKLSSSSREKILKEIADKIKEESNRKKQEDWF